MLVDETPQTDVDLDRAPNIVTRRLDDRRGALDERSDVLLRCLRLLDPPEQVVDRDVDEFD